MPSHCHGNMITSGPDLDRVIIFVKGSDGLNPD